MCKYGRFFIDFSNDQEREEERVVQKHCLYSLVLVLNSTCLVNILIILANTSFSKLVWSTAFENVLGYFPSFVSCETIRRHRF